MTQLSPDFWRSEFACKCGCGYDTADKELVDLLQRAREHLDRKVTVTSGCRCERYNKEVGGSPDSQHLYGRAADIVVEGVPANIVQELFDQWDVPGLGYYDDFTHLDTRTGGARWDRRTERF